MGVIIPARWSVENHKKRKAHMRSKHNTLPLSGCRKQCRLWESSFQVTHSSLWATELERVEGAKDRRGEGGGDKVERQTRERVREYV